MPKKAVSETKGILIHAYMGHDDNLWWSIHPPQTLISGEKEIIWVFRPSKLLDELIRLSTKVAAQKPKGKPPKSQR